MTSSRQEDVHAVPPPTGALRELRISPDEVALAGRHALRRTARRDLSETVIGRVVGHAIAQPDRVAVADTTGDTTYRELVRRVAALRQELREARVRPGQVVAAIGVRGAASVVVLLALEEIGAVYLPIDTSWPAYRITTVLGQSGAVLVIDYRTAGTAGPAQAEFGVPVCRHDEAHSAAVTADARPVAWRTHCADPGEPRYAFFTSGTTGLPKGALIEHRGMVNHLWSKIDDLTLTGADVVAFSAPLAFDIAIWQVLVPLMLGARIEVVDDTTMSFPRRLAGRLQARGITVLELVPTVVGWLADHLGGTGGDLPALRWVISTGEELRPTVARRLLDALPRTGLVNAWGFTECSDDLTHQIVTRADLDKERLPVGPPIANVTLYVLVPQENGWRAARPGEVGEIFAGGVPVGRCYLNDPDATASAFFQDVLEPESPTGRLYKGGDAGFVRDGLLHYLGRLDRQVKVAGVRMELGDIEAALQKHPEVSQCAVVVVGEADDRALLGCVVGRGGAAPDRAAIEAHLTALLPAAMLPRRWLNLSKMPLTGNGKVDHRTLAARYRESMR